MSVAQRFPKMKGLLLNPPRFTQMERSVGKPDGVTSYTVKGFQLEDPDKKEFTANDIVQFGQNFMMEYLLEPKGLFQLLHSVGISLYVKFTMFEISQGTYKRRFQQNPSGFVTWPLKIEIQPNITTSDILFRAIVSDSVSELLTVSTLGKIVDIKTKRRIPLPATAGLEVAQRNLQNDISVFGSFEVERPRKWHTSLPKIEADSIDINGHVGFKPYIEWALTGVANSLTDAKTLTGMPKRERLPVKVIRVKMLNQTFLGDSISLETWPDKVALGQFVSLGKKDSVPTAVISTSLYPSGQPNL